MVETERDSVSQMRASKFLKLLRHLVGITAIGVTTAYAQNRGRNPDAGIVRPQRVRQARRRLLPLRQRELAARAVIPLAQQSFDTRAVLKEKVSGQVLDLIANAAATHPEKGSIVPKVGDY